MSEYLGVPLRTEHLIKEQENEIFISQEYFERAIAQRKITRDKAEFRMACKRETLRELQAILAAEQAAAQQVAA